MLPPIREDLAHKVIVLEEHDHPARNLHNLQRLSDSHNVDSWHSRRKTLENRIVRLRYGDSVRPEVGFGGLVLRRTPRRHRRLLKGKGSCYLIHGVSASVIGRPPRSPPNSCEVRRRSLYCSLWPRSLSEYAGRENEHCHYGQRRTHHPFAHHKTPFRVRIPDFDAGRDPRVSKQIVTRPCGATPIDLNNLRRSGLSTLCL